MIDKDFETQAENAERPQVKKLTAADIPEGFSYAVITPIGLYAIATDVSPKCREWGWDFSEGEFKIIGHGYGFSDWKNSLVSRETAERPQLKKVTAADIPEGYNFAAVDWNGYAIAYKEKPFLADGDNEWSCYTNDFKKIGSFDASDWQNSLVSREPAELPKLKKLTAADIPYCFNYAAVDKDGIAYAYYECPFIDDDTNDWASVDNYHKQIGRFDASDWQNSLVSRENQETFKVPLLSVSEFMQVVQAVQSNKNTIIQTETAERPQADKAEALKDQENKPSFLEIDPNFLEAIAWRMTSNKGKYPPNNWKNLTDRSAILDAVYRHANEIKRILEGGQSLTGEGIQKHCAALACNAQFLFYHSPETKQERAERSRQSNAKQI